MRLVLLFPEQELAGAFLSGDEIPGIEGALDLRVAGLALDHRIDHPGELLLLAYGRETGKAMN